MPAFGKLTVAGTPIGNLADASARLTQVMAAAQTVACEDTRRTGQLYQLLGLKAPKLVSYHKDNETARSAELVASLKAGQNLLLMSDSGMPGLSDPGATLVASARAAGVSVEVIPGPSAVALAVAGSGFAGPFTFFGFLPRKGTARKALLQRMLTLPETLVLFEAPTRVAATVVELAGVLGPRPAWLARELTKMHEEWLGPDLPALAATLAGKPVKGECTLVIQGAIGVPEAEETAVDIHGEIDARLRQQMPVRQVAAWLAGQGAHGSSAAYQYVLARKKLLTAI